jgi:hypothetical protein
MAVVCEDVGTTKRKPLTPSQKLKLYESQAGICPLCSRRMERGEKLIDEHLRALGLGGGNDVDKRAMVHAVCAYEKTYGKDGDIAKIAEAKRRKARSLGFTTTKRPIQSRGFGKAPPQRNASRPLTKVCNPPFNR